LQKFISKQKYIIMLVLVLLFIATTFLAYANGSNDNFKGVATLYGSGQMSYKEAISWATAAQILGSIASVFWAATLVKNFSGKGLIPDTLLMQPTFAIAVALGAALTVILATRFGMPISTTHALVGGLVGTGLVAVGMGLNFGKLGTAFVLPLLISPLLSATLSFLLTKIRGAFFKIENDNHPVLNVLHRMSAIVVCFARGLNDTPKIVGLLLVIQALDIKYGMLTIAAAMAIGGWLNAQKVAETMSQKITAISNLQGFEANLITGILVSTASFSGLPVSTTHVSVGSLFGISAANRQINQSVLKNILLSWLMTLPIAAILSAVLYCIVSI
jgi:inorganic phosphate transporter, PiT family